MGLEPTTSPLGLDVVTPAFVLKSVSVCVMKAIINKGEKIVNHALPLSYSIPDRGGSRTHDHVILSAFDNHLKFVFIVYYEAANNKGVK